MDVDDESVQRDLVANALPSDVGMGFSVIGAAGGSVGDASDDAEEATVDSGIDGEVELVEFEIDESVLKDAIAFAQFSAVPGEVIEGLEGIEAIEASDVDSIFSVAFAVPVANVPVANEPAANEEAANEEAATGAVATGLAAPAPEATAKGSTVEVKLVAQGASVKPSTTGQSPQQQTEKLTRKPSVFGKAVPEELVAKPEKKSPVTSLPWNGQTIQRKRSSDALRDQLVDSALVELLDS